MALKTASPVSGSSSGVSRRGKAVSWTPSALDTLWGRLQKTQRWQESNAGQAAAFLRSTGSSGRWRDVTTVYARLAFDRLPASVRDGDASGRDLAFVHSHGLSTRRGESIAD